MDQRALVERITKEVMGVLQQQRVPEDSMVVPVGISVRHIHVSQKDLDVLYGAGHQLTNLRDLYQEGEFAAREVVTVTGPKMRAVEKVRILGPIRSRTQVELARTDAIYLGIDAPVRKSGDLVGAASITLIGPAGTLVLDETAIVANRHIHMNPDDARRFAVSDNDLVSVEVTGEKALVFRNVQVRVSPKFRLQMHLDTDDANAAGISCGAKARILGRD